MSLVVLRMALRVPALIAAAALTFTVGAPLLAQAPTLAASRSGITRVAVIAHRDTLPSLIRTGSTGARVATSAAGALIGALGGAWLATELLPQSQCGDDPGLCEALPGLAVGSILGAAVGAAMPRGTGECPFRSRAQRGIVGALFGYGFGAVAGGSPLAGLVITGPIGAATGAFIATGKCRPNRAP